ncbi:MAG: hypothetical protein ACT4OD_06090 [Candidatus Nitrosotenuis sp.]
MMHLLLLILLVGVLVLIIPSESYSDTDFILVGNGYGTVNKNVEMASLQASVKILDNGKSVFQSGQFSSGDEIHSINDMNLSLLHNKKFIRLVADSDDFTMSASGRLVISLGDDSIYHLKGKTSTNRDSSFSIFAILKQDKTQVAIEESPSTPKRDVLLLVKQFERVEWKSPYKFTIRTFDPKLNQLSDFHNTSGYLDGITISAIITNPVGDKIKTSTGVTEKFGYYEDSVIIPDNARTGIYTLNVTASGKDYQTTSKEFTFVVIPILTDSSTS